MLRGVSVRVAPRAPILSLSLSLQSLHSVSYGSMSGAMFWSKFWIECGSKNRSLMTQHSPDMDPEEVVASSFAMDLILENENASPRAL